MSSPRVSVCIDVFNYAEFLPRAIESVLEQTMTDFELIVCDDCSTDDSFAIAEQYAARDRRIRPHRNVANQGMIGNRNVALSMARAEYVKFVHADDFLCSKDALERMYRRITANPAASVVACGMQFVRADGTVSGKSGSPFPSDRFIAGTSVITECLRQQKNLLGGPSSVLFRKSRTGRGFDPAYFHAADLEMWFHLLEQGCFAYLPEALTAYRWHPNQQTEKDRATLSQANDQRNMLATYLHQSYVRLRPWLKDYLLHDAVRQTVGRSRKIGQAEQGRKVMEEYGRLRYYWSFPWCYLWRKIGRKLPQEPASPAMVVTAAGAAAPSRPMGINVAGFLKGEYGVGESSRAFRRAVKETGLPTVSINIQSGDQRNRDDTAGEFSDRHPYSVNFMTFSFDYARRFYRDRGRKYFEDRKNVALWYWELETFPVRWHSAFDYYDEIWVVSDFCREALAAFSPVPIHKLTYPFWEAAAPSASGRGQFSLPDSNYLFLFTFDFLSTLARKNPLGLALAFRKAFRADDNVRLVLKSINSDHDPDGKRQLQQAIEGLNVIWIDRHLTGDEMKSLFASVDAYVSLHRSEGLGLGMAQAMSMGKPVIATGYSGNLEFMNETNSLLVNCDRVELDRDYGSVTKPSVYEKGSCWAEPDLSHAAEQMRRLYENRDRGIEIGLRGQKEVRISLDPARTSAEIAARVQALHGTAAR